MLCTYTLGYWVESDHTNKRQLPLSPSLSPLPAPYHRMRWMMHPWVHRVRPLPQTSRTEWPSHWGRWGLWHAQSHRPRSPPPTPLGSRRPGTADLQQGAVHPGIWRGCLRGVWGVGVQGAWPFGTLASASSRPTSPRSPSLQSPRSPGWRGPLGAPFLASRGEEDDLLRLLLRLQRSV